MCSAPRTLAVEEVFEWQLIHKLSEPEFVSDVLDIKRDLSALLSYALIGRIGRLQETNRALRSQPLLPTRKPHRRR
jgi:hypothetical protein